LEQMPESRWRAFLLERPRTAKLATTRKDGRPHIAPIWIDLDDDGSIIFTTSSTSVKGRSIKRDPRISMCVDDDRPPFSYVVLEGVATTSEDPEELLRGATRIGGRYMGSGRAEEFGRRNGVAGEMLVRLKPSRVLAREGISD
jgi:PPOX class probable F420-dependent enzyme